MMIEEEEEGGGSSGGGSVKDWGGRRERKKKEEFFFLRYNKSGKRCWQFVLDSGNQKVITTINKTWLWDFVSCFAVFIS